MTTAANDKPLPVFKVATANEGFHILRDGTPMPTPAGAVLLLPTQPLADAIAAEWSAQGKKPKPETMPFMQLAATAIDIIGKKRDEIVASLAAYAASDLLCHRAEEPPALVAEQEKLWQPWLDWAAGRYHAVLKSGQGIMPISQSEDSLKRLHAAVDACGLFYLAGLQQAVNVSGSLVLGLALAEQAATPQQLFEAAELDALFQMKKWGEDPVTAERHKGVLRELEIAAKWFELLRT